MPKNMYADQKNVIEQIDSAICLLCEANGSCTVSEVMALARVNSTNDTKQLVVNRAEYMEFRVEKSGNGHRIFDWW